MASSAGGPSDRTGPRVLLVISADPSRAQPGAEQPRRDYNMLRDALAADMLTPAIARRSRMGAFLHRRAGRSVALAVEAFRRRHRYDAIYTDGENVGLPLALLLKLSRARPTAPRHVMLSHYLTPAKKRALFRLGVASHIDTLIVHSAAQRELAVNALHIPAARVRRLPYFADQTFWRPEASSSPLPDELASSPLPLPFARGRGSSAATSGPGSPSPREERGAGGEDTLGAGGEDRPMICAVGLEFRDYKTLVAAVTDLDVDLRIAAASAWSHHAAFAGSPALPPNVTVGGYTYLPLRELYAAARVVVVPLRDVDNQAGVTVILEAMAMGKAVIVTATRGQTDVVRDRRNGGRGRVKRAWWPGFVDEPGVASSVGGLATGFYVAPGDPAELRRAIHYLLTHPDLADELGRNGRRVVETCFTLDGFTTRFAAAIRGEPDPAPTPLDSPLAP